MGDLEERSESRKEVGHTCRSVIDSRLALGGVDDEWDPHRGVETEGTVGRFLMLAKSFAVIGSQGNGGMPIEVEVFEGGEQGSKGIIGRGNFAQVGAAPAKHSRRLVRSVRLPKVYPKEESFFGIALFPQPPQGPTESVGCGS